MVMLSYPLECLSELIPMENPSLNTPASLGNGSKLGFRLYSSHVALKNTFAPNSNGFEVDQKSFLLCETCRSC